MGSSVPILRGWVGVGEGRRRRDRERKREREKGERRRGRGRRMWEGRKAEFLKSPMSLGNCRWFG